MGNEVEMRVPPTPLYFINFLLAPGRPCALAQVTLQFGAALLLWRNERAVWSLLAGCRSDRAHCAAALPGALAAVFAGLDSPLVGALRAAEQDHAAAGEALALLDRLPTLRRRRLLATFGAVTWPRPRRRGKHECQSPRSAIGPQA